LLLEYNVRFGDPETQAILVRLETDLVDICEAMLSGSVSSPHVSKGPSLADLNIQWRGGSSACVVLAAKGYPSQPQTGDIINGLDEAKAVAGVEVFHAGTANGPDGKFVTAGGRVLGITAAGNDLPAALAKAYAAVDKISFKGMQYREDIGK
jgi:phosphoribosylamine--glycine ligase